MANGGPSDIEQKLIDEVTKKAKEIGAKEVYLSYDAVSPDLMVTLHTATDIYKVPVANYMLQAQNHTFVTPTTWGSPSTILHTPPPIQSGPAATFVEQFAKIYGKSTPAVVDEVPFKQFWDDNLVPPPVEPPALTVAPLPVISQPASDLFDYDAQGYATPVGPVSAIPTLSKEMTGRIKAIADAFGVGSVVGRGRTSMSKKDKTTWLKAWYAGDLKTCYQVENQSAVKVSARHPGHPANPQTHRIVWAPLVAGELPAGLLPEGDWSSPESHPSMPECNNYLLAAHMAHPEHLTGNRRRAWVQAHLRGHKHIVDEISAYAKTRADSASDQGWDTPQWNDNALAKVAGYDSYLSADTATHLWPVTALKLYTADHQLTHNGTWPSLVNAVQTRRAEAAVAQALGEAKLILTTAPDQPTLSGYHPKSVLFDQLGRRWVFKPARDDAHRYRPEIEHAAHQLARLWGYPTAESHLVDHDGAYGQIQHMFTEAGHLGGYNATQLAGLPATHLIALACEHLLDWAIDNDDSHGENIILTADGHVVGIDKARAFCYFGAWDGLSSHDSANSNAQLVYTELYRAIKRHLIDRDTADRMYRAVLARARRMSRLPDEQMADIIRTGVANRPHYRPPSYRAPHPDAPADADELVAAALARKANLAADMQALWERVYAGAGWELPDPTIGVLGENRQGHLMHSGLHTPELHEAITRSKSYGTPAFVAGEDIEDAHILLWRERCQGVYRVRGQFKIRPGTAYTKVKKWCKEHAVDTDAVELKPPKLIPREEEYYTTIITAAKSVSFHADDGEHNAHKLALLKRTKTYLQIELNTTNQPSANNGSDPYGLGAATTEMATRYLGYITTIEAHKANKTRSEEGDFPRYVYTPVTPAPPDPDPAPLRVQCRRATRAAASHENVPILAADGELEVQPDLVLRNAFNNEHGQPGRMYLVTLPTGEEIEFRADTDTDTRLSQQGLVQFTIPDAATCASSLRRIDDQLTAMGITITDADLTDLELFYWRHLHGVLANRCDSKLTASTYQQAPKYRAYWSALSIPKNGNREAEIAAWHTAFATLTGAAQLAQFVAADGHLPRFMHPDLRNPGQPCGKPYWERFDVPDTKWQSKQMPTLTYRSGPGFIVQTGVAMASEARTRTFAIWKTGMSSTDDMVYGSGAFIFTRNRQEHLDDHQPNVYFSPRIARRTTTYSFPSDKYGRIGERDTHAPFDFDRMMSFEDSSNEMMVKDTVSLLDDIEILLFETDTQRAKAVAQLADLGITDIRGVPVAVRFIVRGDMVAKAKAGTAARESFKRGQHGLAEATR